MTIGVDMRVEHQKSFDWLISLSLHSRSFTFWEKGHPLKLFAFVHSRLWGAKMGIPKSQLQRAISKFQTFAKGHCEVREACGKPTLT